ncbi:MAG: class I SAM-dependent methyltransferase, partial [Proteobacteria bacterium]|nr:class I SAM-dependent methyltransferase [Pseudomonadota bacterium]
MSQAGKPTGLAGMVFGWMMRRSNQEMNRMIATELGLTGAENVLEIGCGTGDALTEISMQIPNGIVLGLDHSALMVKQAINKNRNHKNVKVQLTDFAIFTGQPKSFDQILVSNVHQFWEEPTACFQQIAHLLKSSGSLTVAIRVHNPHDRSFFSKIGYNKTRQQQLFDQLNQAGFNTVLKSQKN